MATFLYKLGRLCFRRRWWVGLAWLAALVAIGFGAATAGDPPEDTFELPGTEGQQAMDILNEEFPQASMENMEGRIVFRAPDGQEITASLNQSAVEDTLDAMRDAEHVTNVSDPFDENNPTVSPDASTTYATVEYDVKDSAVDEAMHEELMDAMELARDQGLTVEASGSVAMGPMEMGGGEMIGVLVAAIVLFITFGALVAAGLPLLTALIGVAAGSLGIAALSATLGLSEMTGILATMIGLAVGIDYALFIVSRYRAELMAGHSREEAAGRAAGTAGSAVVFAGLTVVIALSGLAIVNIPLLTKMGLAAAATVVIAVLIALTLVPAALGMVGKLVFGRRQRRQNPETGVPSALQKNGKENMGSRWARAVLRRPGVVLVTAILGMGVLAVPVASMELGLPDDGVQPEDTTQRKAYDMLSEGFGAGFNGPLVVVLDGGDGVDIQAAGQELAERLEGYEDVVATGPAIPNETGTVATVSVFPESGPSSQETTDLVADLRGDFADDFEEATGAHMLISGQTAIQSDFSKVMTEALVPYLILVVGLAFVLLILVFRSILVPLKAALGFLLSVLAALGVVVAVFQWGWAASLIGVEETSPIMSMMPIFMVGVIFGLAMDYEVFLVTRIREAHVHGEDAHQTVVTGFNLNARVVTAAAIIMISVFGAFAAVSGEAMVKMMGLGMAVAVLLDAFVVRMTIVPAVLGLIGERAWWLPKWLDRILPNVDVEGESLEKYLQQQGKGRDAVTRERETASVG
ncbi:MMPL family transporter [Streptomyces sp. RFCAC02]|uniref:MMPL family transporter n=1 Tax=Streptomyces sp. RFCAC02 TaxID=2499143 RepID=UPI00101F4D17|nr:MMPL family transporter [Streptomyces sp. RFCAC02]